MRCRKRGYRFCWDPFATEPTFQIPGGTFILVTCVGGSYVPHILSSSSCPANMGVELRRAPCEPALANALGQDVEDELQLVHACDTGAVPSGTPTDPELRNQGGPETKGGLFDFEALDAESFLATADEKETCAPAEEVLQHFKRTLDGGLTFHDAAIDEGDVPFLLDTDTDVEDEIAMKSYRNNDRLTLSLFFLSPTIYRSVQDAPAVAWARRLRANRASSNNRKSP